MEFRRASFVFSCPGLDLGGPDRILGPPGQHFGLGTLWGQFLGPEKHTVARNGFVVGIQGNSFCPNEFYGPWGPFGCTSFSKDLLIQLLLFSFVGPLAAYFPLVGTLGCRKGKAALLAHLTSWDSADTY